MRYAHKPNRKFFNFKKYAALRELAAKREYWDTCQDHARAVGKCGQRIIKKTGLRWLMVYFPFVYLFGLLHDFGKLKDAFQEYLDLGEEAVKKNGKHASNHTPGSVRFAVELFGMKTSAAKAMLTCIAGHHGGMSSWDKKINLLVRRSNGTTREAFGKPCDPNYDEMKKEFYELFPEANDYIELVKNIEFPTDKKDLEFLIRLLYSICTLADHHETGDYDKRTSELLTGVRYLTPKFNKPNRRRYNKLLAYVRKLGDDKEKVCRTSVEKSIIAYRKKWLAEALKVAKRDKKHRMFSLGLPTSGAKTLIGLSFALCYAIYNGMDRIIYVGPYLSIIEQNAAVIAAALGIKMDNYIDFLEHHSHSTMGRKLEKRIETGKIDPEDNVKFVKLAEEEWQQGFIVTTTLQILESLFSCYATRTHKILSLANSVIFFDEFQTLPIDLRDDTSDMIYKLVEELNCCVIFGSATNTPWQEIYGKNKQTENPTRKTSRVVQPIIKLPNKTIRCFQRVRTEWIGSMLLTNLAAKICEHLQVLCIVNTRPGAQRLAKLCQATGAKNVFCLETLEHKLHRLDIIKTCQRLLEAGEPVVLISTQCIEAGVDISFPRAFRQIAPLESIAQAAGRCNRNGELGILGGLLSVFDIEKDEEGEYQLTDTFYQFGSRAVKNLIDSGKFDIYDRRVLDEYFMLVQDNSLGSRIVKDQQGGSVVQYTITEARELLAFELVEKGYMLIDHQNKHVLAPRNAEELTDVEQAVATLRNKDSSEMERLMARIKFTGYQVTLYDTQVEALEKGGYLDNPFDGELEDMMGVYVYHGAYDSLVGIPCELLRGTNMI